MLTGSVDGQFGPNDMRSHFPRFSKDNLAHNLQLVEEVKRLAEKENCSPAQLSIAWLLAKDDIFPIPGTKSVDRLQENLGATGLKLSKETMDEIAKTLAGFETKGERYPDMKIVNWQDSENRRKIEEEAQKARGQL